MPPQKRSKNMGESNWVVKSVGCDVMFRRASDSVYITRPSLNWKILLIFLSKASSLRKRWKNYSKASFKFCNRVDTRRPARHVPLFRESNELLLPGNGELNQWIDARCEKWKTFYFCGLKSFSFESILKFHAQALRHIFSAPLKFKGEYHSRISQSWRKIGVFVRIKCTELGCR